MTRPRAVHGPGEDGSEPGNLAGTRRSRLAHRGPATVAEHRTGLDWVVFGVGAGLAVAFVLWGVLATSSLSSTATTLLAGLMRAGGWAFTLAATGFVVFALWLGLGRFGDVRLGGEDEEPQFGTVSWIAMMFSAGMGIGLMFFGVHEPLTFYTDPPPGTTLPETAEALRVSMATSLFHWTLHPWAIYGVVGLAIAHSTFRRGRPQLISQAFVPLIGARAANGPSGKAIDILAVSATLFGSAASLGLGALQIRGGLDASGFISHPSTLLLVGVIIGLTAAFIISAISGVTRGIQWLSNINMVLAALLAVFLVVVGPTVTILNLLPTSIGAYVDQFATMVGRTEAVGGRPMLAWLSSWTVFYWAWWISWAPFVGLFLARISRGRTVRQFLGGVILTPSAVSLVWFAIFGGTAIVQRQSGRVFTASADSQLFEVLQAYPYSTVTSVLVLVLIGIFFVSGADAASIVMGTLSQRGTDKPHTWTVGFWGAVMGAVAVVMMLVGGNDALIGLQSLTILVAAPFVIVMVMLCVALVRDLQDDPVVSRETRSRRGVARFPTIRRRDSEDGERRH